MPPRWLSILIVAVWLSFSARLVVLDLVPRLLPGQPPPYTIDLVEEARTTRSYVHWMVLRDEKPAFRSRSQVLHPEHDVFELTSEFMPLKQGERVSLNGMLLRRLASTYRVNGAGDLLGLSVQIKGIPQLVKFLPFPVETDLELAIEGTVKDHRLRPTIRFSAGEDRKQDYTLPEVRLHQGGSVLLPLHPVNRLTGLSPGQSWQMTVLDPLADSFAALHGGGGELRLLRARVRAEPVEFSRGRRAEKPVLCLVIDYEGDDFIGSTWVERERGLVICQEATLGGENWLMYRE